MGGIPFLQTGKLTRCQVTGLSFLLVADFKFKTCGFFIMYSTVLTNLRVMGVNLTVQHMQIYFFYTLISLFMTVILLVIIIVSVLVYITYEPTLAVAVAVGVQDTNN